MSKQQLEGYLQRVSAELDACVQFWLEFSHDEEAGLVDTLNTVPHSQPYHLLSLQRLLQLPVAGRECVRHHQVLLAAGQVRCCSAAVRAAGWALQAGVDVRDPAPVGGQVEAGLPVPGGSQGGTVPHRPCQGIALNMDKDRLNTVTIDRQNDIQYWQNST